MTEPVYGFVINVNAYGATVRLETGELASAPAGDVEAHQLDYERGLTGRKRLLFQVHPGDRRPMVTIAPQIHDEKLDEQIAEYLESTQEWDTNDEGVPLADRHFLKKKKRAALFESKHSEQP